MIRSMTAFARKEQQSPWGNLSWELRSVNHRYLDLNPRLPEELRALEPQLRERVSQRLGRGKLDATLKFKPLESNQELGVNQAFTQALLAAAQEVETLMGQAQSFHALEVMRWPGVLESATLDMEPVFAAALTLLDEALSELQANREREGARLAELIAERVDGIETLVGETRQRRPEVLAGQRERLKGRIAELDLEVEPQRLEQELVMLAQRLDVEEELDRLDTHIAEVRKVLGQDKPVGRRLDFLMQEFNREANTLGSKSNDAETTRIAVDMKVLIEQMREQVQNIE